MKYVVIGNYNGHMRHIIAKCNSQSEAHLQMLAAIRRDARRPARSKPGRLEVEIAKIVFVSKSARFKNART